LSWQLRIIISEREPGIHFDFSHRGGASRHAIFRPVTRDPAMNVITTSFSISATAFAMFMAALVQPALSADAFNGERLAQRWCAACHVVTAAQRQANADAPPFEEIAKRPNFTENGLMTFLLNPHATMPDMSLTRIEAGDIAAYVAKLK
jgi:mono/diheme cytochrome c family protein